jgi:glycosyltransferase involved in cell wall biosynthesis
MVDISICMITYNHQQFIEEAISSVLCQKTKYSFELIIGEDCSTDNTRTICEKYAKQYPDKIKLLPSEKNYGVAPNFKRTLEACTGRYIAICEGDDYWINEEKLQIQVAFMDENLSYVICAGRSKYLDYKGKIREIDCRINKKQSDFTTSDYLLKMSFETATILYRNCPDFTLPQLFTEAFSADQLLVLLLTKNGGKIKYLDTNLATYRYHKGGITKKTSQKVIVDRLFSLLDNFDAITNGQFKKYIELRKRFTLISRNHLFLNWPSRVLFIISNFIFALRYNKYIPFNVKLLARYLLPIKK